MSSLDSASTCFMAPICAAAMSRCLRTVLHAYRNKHECADVYSAPLVEPAFRVGQACAVPQCITEKSGAGSRCRGHVVQDLWERPPPTVPLVVPLKRPVADVTSGESRQAQPRGSEPVVRDILPYGR